MLCPWPGCSPGMDFDKRYIGSWGWVVWLCRPRTNGQSHQLQEPEEVVRLREGLQVHRQCRVTLGQGHFHVCEESQSQGGHGSIAHRTVCL